MFARLETKTDVDHVAASNSPSCEMSSDDGSILLQADCVLNKVTGDGRCLFRCLVLACEEASSDNPLSSNINQRSNLACDKLRKDIVAALREERNELGEKSTDLPFILDN